MLEASIVVPTHDRPSFLADCLERLVDQDQAAHTYEVLVVDDGSPPSTGEVIRRVDQVSEVLVRHLPQPHGGVNAARNRGVEEARGSVVFFIDDDELVPRHYMSRALALLADRPEVVGVGGPVLDPPLARRRTCSRCSLGEVRRDPDEHGRFHELLGGNMAIRREAFGVVGPFAEGLSGRGDDTEWFSRNSLEWYYTDALYVWHRKDQDGIALLRDQFRQGRAIPAYHAMTSDAFRPSWRRVAIPFAHGLRRRCLKGFVLAARELGAIAETIHRWVRRRRAGG